MFSTCIDVQRSLATKGDPWTPTVFCVTGVTISACQARFAYVCMYVCMHGCMYVCMYAFLYVCMFVCMYVCMYVCARCCIQLIALRACSSCTPAFQIVIETHSNITSHTDKIQGKHFHIPFPPLSFTTSSPFPLSFPLFLHIPFLHFAFNLNSVSEGNWEHVGLSGPIITCYFWFDM